MKKIIVYKNFYLLKINKMNLLFVHTILLVISGCSSSNKIIKDNYRFVNIKNIPDYSNLQY